jgi:predicted SAM-dependent methyltransferase
MDLEKLRHPLGSWRVRRAVDRVMRNRRWGFKKHRIVGKEYLDVGCGDNVREEFITLDYNWNPRLDICWDVTTGIPLEDASLRGVYTEHCIEHLSVEDNDALFGEFARVLAPGGTVRIIVPDGELYARRYLGLLDGASDEPLPYAEDDGVRGLYTPMMSVNRIFNSWGHRFIFDFETMKAMLERRGFENVTREQYGSGRDPVLLIDNENHVQESLYVEASMPR